MNAPIDPNSSALPAPRAGASAPREKAPEAPRAEMARDAYQGARRETSAPAGEATVWWDDHVRAPIERAEAWVGGLKGQGGAKAVLGHVLGVGLWLSGLPSITRNLGTMLDSRKSTGERVKAGLFGIGEAALTLIPVGKIGGIGAKLAKATGLAGGVQRLRNATLLGAEVKAGTKMVHFTTAEGATRIAESGLLKGSTRGFLSMGGKGGHRVLTRRGLEKQFRNNGQVYAVAADGRSSAFGRVIDAIVGVAPESRLGKALGKITPAKTSYKAGVEHVLTAEQAARARRWGKTIVVDVAPGEAGLKLSAEAIARLPRFGADEIAQKVAGQRVSLGPVDKAIEGLVNNRGLVASLYGKVVLRGAQGE